MKSLVASFFLSLVLSFPAGADSVPTWFTRDVQRKAQWLPQDIQTQGVDAVYRLRWASFPADVQGVLTQMAIPHWMVALVPSAVSQQAEILKQFRFMAELAGSAPTGAIALRAEQLLIFGGSAQLPTPGDAITGVSLGAEGCTAAMSKYILAQLALEFPNELSAMPAQLTNSQSSVQMESLFDQLFSGPSNLIDLVSRPFAQLQTSDVQPGSLMIGQKPGGTHVFGWTRVPQGWGWSPGDKMAIGNTGLAQFGDRMILAQEYVTDNPSASGELTHNQHGPINSNDVIYGDDGEPDLSNPGTNVYAAQGSDFVIVDFN